MDQKYWSPHAGLHALLQSYGTSLQAPAAIQKQLEAQQDWLLHSLAFFRRPNEEAKKTVSGLQPSITLRGRKFAIDKPLVPLTLKLSSLLDLDELQTHILLKRWVKDVGIQVQGQTLELELEEMLQVLEYYHQERLLLLKSVQFILLQGVTEALFAQSSSTLVRSGLEDRVISVLRENVETPHPVGGGIGPHPGALSAHMLSVLKEFGGQQANMAWLSVVHSKLREQQLAERCEIVSTLLLLYEVVGVKCSSSRAAELIQLTRSASTAFSLPANGHSLHTQHNGQPSMALVAEQLSCMLVLSVLDLPAYIHLASTQPSPESVPMDSLPLGSKLHDAHSNIRNWPSNPASSLLLLTWGAVAQLLDPYASLGENAAVDLQAQAAEAGLFQAAAACLEATVGMVSTAVAQLCRGVALKAVSVSATAFELGPSRQDPASFSWLVRFLKHIVADDSHVCTEIWDTGLELLAPVRAILLDTCTIFPASPRPYLQLLGLISHGPLAASAAYTHLQTYPMLTCLHHTHDPTLQRLGHETLVLATSTMWPQAPSVTTLALPVGIEGQILPWPAAIADKDPNEWMLVRWDVNSSIRSFGQLLLLGRAVHCLLHLRGCANSACAIDQSLVQELGDMLSLMASLSHEHPDAVPDLVSLGVEAAEARGAPPRKWSWLDVAARGVELYLGLLTMAHAQTSGTSHADLLSHTVSSIKLLSSLSSFFPERVLAAMQSLPLVAWQLPPSTFGYSEAPASVPLADLPALNGQPTVLVGIMPQLRAFQQQCEGAQGSYPVTLALLDLASTFLERGYAKGFASAMVLFALNEVLPSHHQWQYHSASVRWSLSASLLKVLHLSITSGSFAEGCSGTLPMPTESVGAGAVSASAASPSPTHVNELAALVLQQLLFHGTSLLFYVLPPPHTMLESLRMMDAQNPELIACEGCLGALLQLLPTVLAAGHVYQGHELPLEAFMFHGIPTGQPPPATSLCSFVGYEQPELEASTPLSISYHALKLVRALQASAARLSRFQPTTHLSSTIMPKEGTAQAALIELFRADTARARPAHFALAVEVLEAAVNEHPGIIDGLLYAAGNGAKDTQKGDQGDQARPREGGGADAQASKQQALPPLSSPPGPQRSVLDGLLELVACHRELRSKSPEVLCALMRALGCLWQPHSFSQPPTVILRDSPDFWACLEECVTRGVPDLKSWQPTDSPHLQLSEAYAWQILLLEAFACNRAAKDGLSPEASNTDKEASQRLEGLLWKLRDTGALYKAATHYTDLGPSQQQTRQLWASVHALYLELGACAVSGGFGTPTLAAVPAVDGGISVEDRTSMAPEIKQELAEVVHALRTGACTLQDVEDLHALLLQQATPANEQQQQQEQPGTPGSPASPSLASPVSFQASPLRSPGSPLVAKPAQRLYQMLLAHPLGSAVMRRVLHAPGLSNKAASYGPSYLLDPWCLTPLLGALVPHLPAADALVDSVAAINTAASLAHARLAALQAATALMSVMSPEDPKQSRAPEGGRGSVAEAAAVTVSCISGLSSWISSDLSKFGLAPWSGLRALERGVEQAALAATHMAMHALNHARQIHQITRAQQPPPTPKSAPPPRINQGMSTPPRPRVLNARAAPSPTPLQLQQEAARSKPDQAGASVISPSDCQQLANLLNTWLRLGPRAAGLVTPAVLSQVGDNLATALLVAVQLYGDRADTQARHPDHVGLQMVLLDLLPQLSKAVSVGAIDTTLGTQVMLELVAHHLPAADWLPVMKAHLNLQAMLVQAASQVPAFVAAAAAGAEARGVTAEQESTWSGAQGKSLGMLQLALAVARVPDGARWMEDCGVLEFLHAMARQLLTAEGSGLAPVHVRLDPAARPDTSANPLTRPFIPDPLQAAPSAPTPPIIPSAPPTSMGATPTATTNPTLGFSLVPYAHTHGGGGGGLLSPGGMNSGTAGNPPFLGGASGIGGGSARVDTACAYGGGALARAWSPAHQQWCVLISFASALLRSLGQFLDVEAGSIDFLAAIEPRLLLVCLPPAGDAAQPLTLACLFELERVLFLLCHFARYAGSWHFCLPGSLPKFRMALTSFLSFAAKADSNKPVTLECPPQSALEREMAAQPTGVPCTKGWFRVCTLGACNPGEVAPPTPTTATRAQAGALLALPNQSVPPTPLTGFGRGTGEGEEGSTGAPSSCSLYSARMAESMYTCILHACIFLRATAPQVSEGEAGSLSGTWPRPRDLALLQAQVLDVLYSLRGGDDVDLHNTRLTRTCGTLVKTLHLLCDFVDVVGCPSNRRVWHGELREHLGAIETALLRQEPLPHLATLFSSSAPSHSGSMAVPTQSGTLSLSMSMGTM